MITLSEINEAYRNATPEERREFIELILPELIKNPKFQDDFNNRIIMSPLKPVKRIAELEKVTGIYQFEDFEEHEPTLPEQLIILSEKIDSFELNKAAVVQIQPKHIIPETKTEARAVFLVQYLEKEVKERNGELFLNGSEIKDLIIKTIPEKNPDCQIKKGQNIRKLKKDVLEKAAKLFPGNIFINKNKNGRHETRILFKPLLTVT
jgi:hypothetical protein